MTPVEVLNEELKRLHASYALALEVERSGVRMRGEGYQVAIERQIQHLTNRLFDIARIEAESKKERFNEKT